MQIVDVPSPRPLTVVDLEALDADAQQAEVRRLVDADAQRPFDLARGPLVRSTLLRLAPERHVLICTMHHVVTDAWSFRVLSAELSALCLAFGAGQPSSLGEPSLQYADYAVWQRTWLSGNELAQRLAYWRDHLADATVQLPHPLVEFLPEVGEGDDRALAPRLEVLATVLAGAPDVVVVERELLLELGRRELLGEDGRDVQRPLGRDPLADQPVRDVEQRKIALEGGLVEPVAAVWPAAVIDHHRKMSVEDQ